MQSRWGKAMAGGQAAIDRLLADVDREHEGRGVPNGVTLAFEILAPLLVEYEAIQTFVREREDPALMGVLIDLTSPREAAHIGALEYRLTPEDQALLESLLAAELDAQRPSECA